jgi:hypothetical protein
MTSVVLGALVVKIQDELGEGVTNSIATALQADPLSEQIVLFLLENETAMDTARGIANWWVRRDELAVQAALDRLIASGIVTPHTFTSGILYSLTKNQKLLHQLRTTYGDGSKARIHSPSDGRGWPSDGNRPQAENA